MPNLYSGIISYSISPEIFLRKYGSLDGRKREFWYEVFSFAFYKYLIT